VTMPLMMRNAGVHPRAAPTGHLPRHCGLDLGDRPILVSTEQIVHLRLMIISDLLHLWLKMSSRCGAVTPHRLIRQ
jgi:hypothetical protein